MSCDTKIAFCPWSGGPLSYLGLTGEVGGGDIIAKLTNWEEPIYSDDNHLKWKILLAGKYELISMSSPR